MAELRLDQEQLLELAELVAERVAARLAPAPARAPAGLVDAQAVADRYGVERSWVYEHAGELGAVRLGQGPRARLRFDLKVVGERLTACPAGRKSGGAETAMVEPNRRRRRPRRSGTAVELLPIRGESRG